MISYREHPFNRCGLAALSDLETPEWRVLFSFLEQDQSTFLSLEGQFRSPDYIWPRDPLHGWSRVWEYPYVYHHLKLLRPQFDKNLPHIVDFGSGVTFFPFSVARLGYHVSCLDIDPVFERDLNRAIPLVPHKPGSMDVRLTDAGKSRFSDGEIDIVYSISVLEHVPELESTIVELARILRPGGFLLLTIDLDLRGDLEIGVERYKSLIQTLRRYFQEVYPDSTIHPADLLHSASGPFGFKPLRGFNLAKFILKQQILKPLIGRKPTPMFPFHLGVQGFVLAKNP